MRRHCRKSGHLFIAQDQSGKGQTVFESSDIVCVSVEMILSNRALQGINISRRIIKVKYS